MGVCIQQWENYTCDCSMTSFTGMHCNDPFSSKSSGDVGANAGLRVPECSAAMQSLICEMMSTRPLMVALA
ncbi:hypothetical protein PDJAM_G00021430 [Pangasius djambal]|uniref:Uncharacterized protein n=1 Tax=Pangasius djambal TaxID=1691987 RepID=A0ACC5YND7_9TELE|nr:hypothetical protein [Pangasius djambal]